MGNIWLSILKIARFAILFKHWRGNKNTRTLFGVCFSCQDGRTKWSDSFQVWLLRWFRVGVMKVKIFNQNSVLKDAKTGQRGKGEVWVQLRQVSRHRSQKLPLRVYKRLSLINLFFSAVKSFQQVCVGFDCEPLVAIGLTAVFNYNGAWWNQTA